MKMLRGNLIKMECTILFYFYPPPPPLLISVAATSHGLIATLVDFEVQLIVSFLCLQKCQMNVEIVKNIG